MTERKRITIVTPCYNEELNVRELHRRTRAVMDTLPQYEYRHIFIDNASRDGTVAVLRAIAADLQEPPELFAEMLARWEEGFPIVAAVKTTSEESGLMYNIRTAYYNL